MTDLSARMSVARHAPGRSRGQALVLFALFLLVLLGASAVAIDYANWLLTDRRLQNVADHAALAGAAMFDQTNQQPSCGTSPALCDDARAQAWESLNQDLSLGLSDATVSCLAQRDTPVGGYKNASDSPDSCAAASFKGHTLWVSTPPPNNVSYTGVGGRYALNNAVVFARVNEPTRSFFAGVFGIVARDRIGWATAGPLPTDFALQLFCRNGIAPQNGACGGSGATSLVIDGQGGIQLLRGDIGSNESLKVTATNGGGVILNSGRMFLVNGTCSQALWRCPNGPPSLGGLSDGAPNYNGQNAFLMPPQPVPHYASPLDDVGVADRDCLNASATSLCVPYRGDYPGGSADKPGDWACTTDVSDFTKPLCGIPRDYTTSGPPVNDTVRCVASVPEPDGFLDPVTNTYHMHPQGDLDKNTPFQPHTLGPKDVYRNIEDADAPRTPDTGPTDNWVYTKDGVTNATYRVALSAPPGIPDPGSITLRWIPFRTLAGAVDTLAPGDAVTISVELDEQRLVGGVATWVPVAGAPTDSVTITAGSSSPYSVRPVSIDASFIRNYNALSLKFTVTTTASSDKTLRRGGGVSWAELETTKLSPALPAMIPPGYYHSIVIPDGRCAVMDPTAAYWALEGIGSQAASPLKVYQKAGIYRFGGGSNDAEINIGAGSFLIGDGVTLVFNPEFPDPTGGKGIVIGSGGALVLNTLTVPGTPAPCTPTETDLTAYNPSQPLVDPNHNPIDFNYGLPYSSVCAAWAVDSTSHAGIHAGTMLWTGIDPATNTAVPYCADDSLAQCISRGRYAAAGLPAHYRGITFYFSTNNWPATTIRGRFQMSAGGGNCDGSQPGIAFRGVLYAPYDDVVITAGSNFGTVGQILAWTAKFNGACPNLLLDYPYQSEPAPPYLLEPGLGQ